MKKFFLKILTALVCLSVVLSAFVHSNAVPVDMTAVASLTVTLEHESRPISGSYFSLYRIADISRSGAKTLTLPFADFPVAFETGSASDLRKLALTLKGYVFSENILPDYTGVTDTNGQIRFNDIPLGMYLVIGSAVTKDGITYVPETFVITLPAEAEDEMWEYNVTVRTKTIMGYIDDVVNLRVLKVWDDSADSSSRPDSVVVDLYSGSELYGSVTLSKENNWHYTWSDLQGVDWTVVERNVPDGYSVSVDRDGNTFIITNTKTEELSPTMPDSSQSNTTDTTGALATTYPPSASVTSTTSADGSVPQDGEQGSGSNSGGDVGQDGSATLDTTTAVTSDDDGNTSELPQTGMLWWPVPVLSALGMLLVVIGWRINRRAEDEN